MRLWSIHPMYLDRQGLQALWREALLAQALLERGEWTTCESCGGEGENTVYPFQKCKECKGLGKRKTGYWNHSHLLRFKRCEYPLRAIGQYLTVVYEEGKYRGLNFNAGKIKHFYRFPIEKIKVTRSQVLNEYLILEKKLRKRSPGKNEDNWYKTYNRDAVINVNKIRVNDLFEIVDGPIEAWERRKFWEK